MSVSDKTHALLEYSAKLMEKYVAEHRDLMTADGHIVLTPDATPEIFEAWYRAEEACYDDMVNHKDPALRPTESKEAYLVRVREGHKNGSCIFLMKPREFTTGVQLIE